MKITRIETIPMNLPLNKEYRWAQAVVRRRTKILIRVHTDDGIVGVAEGVYHLTSNTIKDILEPRVLGEDPFQIEKITAKCLPFRGSTGVLGLSTSWDRIAFASLEIALWDIMGKATGRPVCDLLGGRFRTKIPVVFFFATDMESRALLDECLFAIKHYGVKTLEGKVGILSPKEEVEILKGLRSAVGENIDIRVDANGQWPVSIAVETLRDLEKLRIANVEEPTRGLRGMSEVKRKVSIPLSTHVDDIPIVVQMKAADNIVGDIFAENGLLGAKKIAAIAEAYEMGFWLRSHTDLGISLAAALHLTASTPSMTFPNQYDSYLLADDVVKNRLLPEAGCIRVPEGPGLGVDVDEAKVDKFNQLYKDEGPHTWIPRSLAAK